MADQLSVAGYDAVHVRDLGLLGASDEKVLATAVAGGRAIVSADTDFGEIAAGAVVVVRRSRVPRVRPLPLD
jgi:predicted nuclease of predicted toxin-antitoxin system